MGGVALTPESGGSSGSSSEFLEQNTPRKRHSKIAIDTSEEEDGEQRHDENNDGDDVGDNDNNKDEASDGDQARKERFFHPRVSSSSRPSTIRHRRSPRKKANRLAVQRIRSSEAMNDMERETNRSDNRGARCVGRWGTMSSFKVKVRWKISNRQRTNDLILIDSN